MERHKNKFDRYEDIRLFTDGVVSQLIVEYPDDEFTIRNIIDDKIQSDLRSPAMHCLRTLPPKD